MALPLKTKDLKFIALIAYIAFLATTLLTATSYGEKSIITELSVTQLSLCSVTSLAIPITLLMKKGGLKVMEWLVWIAIAIGCAFLAMDDRFMFHEKLDKAIHSLFNWEETKLSDRLDDIIVGIYGVAGIIFVTINRKHFGFSPRFITYSKYALGLAFIMVLCDMRSIYGIGENLNESLSHIEEWTKIFGSGSLFIGLLCALEDALCLSRNPSSTEIL